MTSSSPTVIVIGAGIIGAAAAHALQSAGAQVCVVDAGGDTATDASFGWINASFHHDAAHFRLRAEGIAAWRRLSEQMSLPVTWQGTLCWEETGTAFDAQRETLQALGYAVQEIDRDAFTKLEPHVAAPPDRALQFTGEAAADSPQTARTLLSAAIKHGAQHLRGFRVDGFVENAGRIAGVRTAAGNLHADYVLIAAGTGSGALMQMAGTPMPMLHRPALVVRTRPVRPVLAHILVSEFGELRQLADGSLLMPAAVSHQADAAESVAGDPQKVAAQVLSRLSTLLPDLDLDWAELTLAHRPVPQDGLPVIGAVRDGLHVACMHSGITLAAITGEMVAQEMLRGVSNASAARLEPYRPARL